MARSHDALWGVPLTLLIDYHSFQKLNHTLIQTIWILATQKGRSAAIFVSLYYFFQKITSKCLKRHSSHCVRARLSSSFLKAQKSYLKGGPEPAP